MSLSPINHSSRTNTPPVPSGANFRNAAANARQEATETADTTRQEAARGDQAAIRKLAQITQQAKLSENSARAPKPSQNEFEGIDNLA